MSNSYSCFWASSSSYGVASESIGNEGRRWNTTNCMYSVSKSENRLCVAIIKKISAIFLGQNCRNIAAWRASQSQQSKKLSWIIAYDSKVIVWSWFQRRLHSFWCGMSTNKLIQWQFVLLIFRNRVEEKGFPFFLQAEIIVANQYGIWAADPTCNISVDRNDRIVFSNFSNENPWKYV